MPALPGGSPRFSDTRRRRWNDAQPILVSGNALGTCLTANPDRLSKDDESDLDLQRDGVPAILSRELPVRLLGPDLDDLRITDSSVIDSSGGDY